MIFAANSSFVPVTRKEESLPIEMVFFFSSFISSPLNLFAFSDLNDCFLSTAFMLFSFRSVSVCNESSNLASGGA